MKHNINILGRYLQYPAYEEVLHYIRDLSWDERLDATSVIKGIGTRFHRYYSIIQLGDHIMSSNAYLMNGGGLDFKKGGLVFWLRHAIGDQPLADAVEKAEGVFQIEADARDAIFMILEARITQYREVLEASG